MGESDISINYSVSNDIESGNCIGTVEETALEQNTMFYSAGFMV